IKVVEIFLIEIVLSLNSYRTGNLQFVLIIFEIDGNIFILSEVIIIKVAERNNNRAEGGVLSNIVNYIELGAGNSLLLLVIVNTNKKVVNRYRREEFNKYYLINGNIGSTNNFVKYFVNIIQIK
ncbi:hypothetical protein OFB99_24090, partial [Escherichia coli]|nr:hypothetical protein [Escherichia coli]